MEHTPLRVVLADDDPDIRRMLKAVLDQEGLDVIAEAADGGQAIVLAEAMRPDVMLIDMMMPIINGAEAARVISQRWPDVILVGLTAGGWEARANLLSAGANSVFDKTQICDVLEWLTEQQPSRTIGARGV